MRNCVFARPNLLAVLLAFLWLSIGEKPIHGQQERPQDAFGEWRETTDVASLGWSRERLRDLSEYVDSIGSASVLIVTQNKVVFSHGDLTKPYRAHSIRKSFLSALIGIAIDEGKIDLAGTLTDLEIGEKTPLTDAEGLAMVADLLKARSGVYLPAASETKEIVAGRPQRHQYSPGEHWFYNNWDFNALGTIYRRQMDEDIFVAVESRIAKPIEMQDFDLEHTRYQLEDVSQHPSYKFRISTRDLARFGLLYLNKGKWSGEEVIPAKWVEESTQVHSLTGSSGTKSGYGMMWWVNADRDSQIPLEQGAFTASGTGGQRLTVLPSLETVIVHRVDTDDKDGPRVGTSGYHRFLSRVMAARSTAVDQDP